MTAMAVVNLFLALLGCLATGVGDAIPWFTTMREIVRDGSVGGRSSFLYVVGGCNYLLWVVYAVPKESVVIFFINLLGLALMVYYVVKFLCHCTEGDFLPRLIAPVSGVLAVICVLIYYSSNWKENVAFLSWACGLSRGFFAVAPLFKLPVALREGNMQSMPSLPMAATAVLGAVFWSLFAITDSEIDGTILWPSLAGIVSGAVQVTFHIILREKNELAEPLF